MKILNRIAHKYRYRCLNNYKNRPGKPLSENCKNDIKNNHKIPPFFGNHREIGCRKIQGMRHFPQEFIGLRKVYKLNTLPYIIDIPQKYLFFSTRG